MGPGLRRDDAGKKSRPTHVSSPADTFRGWRHWEVSATLRREPRCGATIKMRLPVKHSRGDDIRAAPAFG